MEITKRTVKRRITEDEFLRMKNIEPFATFRQDAKKCNFGMIFGISYRKFSTASLETSWPYERVQQFVKEKNLYDVVDKMAERHGELDAKLWEYYAVSDYLRKQFFETYPGLMGRIERNKAFAIENGYIRSFHGAIRRVPLLMWMVNEEGKIRQDENKKEFANLVNITSNTSIQTDEVATVMQAINTWEETEDLTKGWVIGTVHDSVDFYVLKKEIESVLQRMKEVFEKEEDWAKGVSFPVDITICDLSQPEENWYKHGTPVKKFLEQLEKKVA
jgi:DNA polymerase I-like protein with 3'-5' exonuclease and polymerase domains